jgi:uncharacterized protein YecE (DUF72 family)
MSKSPENILIGCGGWGYFPITSNRLHAYSQAFSMVEVNSTFYELPPISQVQRWKQTVPSTFLFSVKGHQSITHVKPLELTPQKLDTIHRLRAICQILESPYLVLQFPMKVSPSDHTLAKITQVLKATDLGETQPVIELRNPRWQDPEFHTPLLENLAANNCLLCTDLSRTPPIKNQESQYSRIFGHGDFNRWEFTDKELQTMVQTCENVTAHQVTMVFHSIRMYEAAIRTRYYRNHRRFPESSLIQQYLPSLLTKFVKYPLSKKELLEQIGWRVTHTAQGQTHALTLLKDLPEKTYTNKEQVLSLLTF